MKKILFLLLTVSFSSAFAQNGLHFDGSDDLVQTSFPGILGNNAITVEAWIQPEGVNGEEVITAWGSDAVNGARFTFRCATATVGRVIRIENKGGGLNGTVNVADGNWHHVAVTYDPTLSSNKYKLFVDGVLDVEGDISQALNILAATDMRMGRRLSTTFTGFFDGKMDEVRVWDVARTEQELYSNKDSEFCTYPASLVAYYPFNQGIADGANAGVSYVTDVVNGFDGALLTFALTGTTSNWVTGATLTGGNVVNNTVFSECLGFSVDVNGNIYDATGVYSDTIVGGSASGCDSIIVTNLTINPAATFTQTFDECAGFSVTVNGNTYDATGVYTDIFAGAAANGCDSTVTTDLTIAAPVDVTTSLSVLTISATSATGSYQWMNCDSGFPIPGEMNQDFTATVNGNYAVIVTDGMCSDTSSCVAITTVGMDEMNNNLVTVSPNPATDFLMVNIEGVEKSVQLSITNLLGQTVISMEDFVIGNAINTQNLTNGTYILTINNETSIYQTKFVKQ